MKKKINYYDVQILKNGTKEFKIQVKEVLDINDEYTVLKDNMFTVLYNETSKGDSHYKIGKSSISEWKYGFSSMDGIHYTLYSYKNVNSKTIKNEIQKFIDKNYGFLFDVNLDFIK